MEQKRIEDRRVARTKEGIRKAFAELLAEKEFEQITINHIADKANISRGTIYLHYADKYDLLEQYLDNELNQLLEMCTSPQPASGNEVHFIRDLEQGFIYFQNNHSFFFILLSNKGTSRFRERLLTSVAVNIKEQLTALRYEEAESEIMSTFISHAFVGLVEWWIRNEMPYSPQVMSKQVRKLLEKHGLFSHA